jgi:hypothetical protein
VLRPEMTDSCAVGAASEQVQNRFPWEAEERSRRIEQYLKDVLLYGQRLKVVRHQYSVKAYRIQQ